MAAHGEVETLGNRRELAPVRSLFSQSLQVRGHMPWAHEKKLIPWQTPVVVQTMHGGGDQSMAPGASVPGPPVPGSALLSLWVTDRSLDTPVAPFSHL